MENLSKAVEYRKRITALRISKQIFDTTVQYGGVISKWEDSLHTLEQHIASSRKAYSDIEEKIKRLNNQYKSTLKTIKQQTLTTIDNIKDQDKELIVDLLDQTRRNLDPIIKEISMEFETIKGDTKTLLETNEKITKDYEDLSQRLKQIDTDLAGYLKLMQDKLYYLEHKLNARLEGGTTSSEGSLPDTYELIEVYTQRFEKLKKRLTDFQEELLSEKEKALQKIEEEVNQHVRELDLSFQF